jgi:signal transduction histidine kinase
MTGEKVLIVEDESVVALNIHLRLEGAHYAVAGIADSADMAMQLTAQTAPDLILMDIRLKGELDGIQTAQLIQEHYDIPVVYLTAYTDPDTLQQAKATLPYGYILKPFETADLCTAIELALHKHQADQKVRQAEARLQHLNDQLEQRVQQRTAELEIANQRLQLEIGERQQAEAAARRSLAQEQELNDLKSRFITTASHEFRTPLSIILTSAELLECFGADCPIEKRNRYVQKIRDAVQGLTTILSDMLTLGKAESGTLEFKPVPLDLAAFCQELVEDLQLATNRQPAIQLQLTGSCNALTLDSNLLMLTLMNLLSNAIKYSPPNGNISLTVECPRLHMTKKSAQAKSTDRVIIFHVKDEGIGIPAEDLPHLFESFHRAKNVETIGGTGLGLAIVQRCVELHGGTIAVNSQVDQGTIVTVTLPVAIGV